MREVQVDYDLLKARVAEARKNCLLHNAIDLCLDWAEKANDHVEYCHGRMAKLEQENERLREALGDAIDSYEEYAQYAGDYLMKKHRVDEDIAELRKVLESSDG